MSYNPETGELPPLQLEMSGEIGEIAAAIAKMQGKIENATKDRKNEHFRSSYATLASVYDACRVACSEAGVAVIQAPFNQGDDIGVVTLLAHQSGQWLRGKLHVRPVKYDAQGAGSVITYLRRYILSAMIGVAPEDDDGEAAVGRPQNAPYSNGARNGSRPPANGHGHQAPAAAAPAARPDDNAEAPAHQAADDRQKMADLYKSLSAAISGATSADMVDQVGLDREADIQRLKGYSETGYDKLRKMAVEKKASFGPVSSDDPPI